MPLHIETPLLKSQSLSNLTHGSVWLKLDALQPPGAFKIRGVGAACEHYAQQGARRFVSSSGGNAGMAVAYAGQCLSIPVTVVVPETATARAKTLLRQLGATVIIHGPSWQEANEKALSMLGERDAFIHPFDNPLLWQGHATMIDEVARSGLRPDAVVLSVGGGGLLCGVLEGLHRNQLAHVPVLAVETAGAASFHKAQLAGRLVELDQISSVASSLGAKQVCERVLQWNQAHDIRSVVVSDQAALSACTRFLDDHRLLVEPACGAAIAPVYEQASVLKDFETILLIVCGGATATFEQICQWLENERSRQSV